jgi:hypothetical protein
MPVSGLSSGQQTRNISAPLWVVGILNGIQAPVNQANVWLLEFWAQDEQGTSNWETVPAGGAGQNIYNPFNIVTGVPGAPPPAAVTGIQGDIQVNSSWANGVAQTVAFLKQPDWAPLVQAMQQGAPLSSLYSAVNWRANTGTTGGPYPPSLYAYLNGTGPGPSGVVTQGSTSSYSAVAGTNGGPITGVGVPSGVQGGLLPTGCGAKGDLFNFDLKVTSVGLSACQAKAIKGGLLVAVGGATMLFGVALIVISGFAGKGPLSPVVDVAAGYVAGARKIPGVKRASSGTTSSDEDEATVTARDRRILDRQARKGETSIPAEVNYSGGRARRSESYKGFDSDTPEERAEYQAA